MTNFVNDSAAFFLSDIGHDAQRPSVALRRSSPAQELI